MIVHWLWLPAILLPWLGAAHLWLHHRRWNREPLIYTISWLAFTTLLSALGIWVQGTQVFSAAKSENQNAIPLLVIALLCLTSFALTLRLIFQSRQSNTLQNHWPVFFLLLAGAISGLGMAPNLLVLLICFLVLTLSGHRLIFPPDLVDDIQTDRLEHLDRNRDL